jgi:hypothetical protein
VPSPSRLEHRRERGVTGRAFAAPRCEPTTTAPPDTGSAGALLGLLAALGLVAVGIAVDLFGCRGCSRIGVLVGLLL